LAGAAARFDGVTPVDWELDFEGIGEFAGCWPQAELAADKSVAKKKTPNQSPDNQRVRAAREAT
jgi:hypothetical protein